MKYNRTIPALMLIANMSIATLLPVGASATHTEVVPVSGAQQSPASAAVAKEWLVVPVFYATNRAFAGEDSNAAYSEVPNASGLLFGVKNIATPVPVRSPLDKDTETKMSWTRIEASEASTTDPKEPPAPPAVDGSTCAVKNKILTRDEIVPAFTSYMHDTGNHETVIFVHGCCSTFNRSMERAATISAHMQVPVLLYDWVSPKGFRKYLENETRAEQTMDDFCRFLTKVEKLTDPGNVTLIGHSVGARFVDQSMVRRSQRFADQAQAPKFKELIITNGDTDAKSFLNHAKEFSANAEKTRIYFNSADEVLDASALAHGGFTRLGNPGTLLGDLCKTDGLELVDMTANNSKHEIPFWIIGNLHKYNNLGPVKEFQLKQVSPRLLSVVRTELSQSEPVQTISESKCVCHQSQSE